MQFKLSALIAATLATSVIAGGSSGGGSQCSTGPVQCCDSVEQANSPAAAKLLALLGVVVQDVTALVGITCTPIDVIGIGSNSCSAQTVCCQNNNFNGVIALGCTPVNVNV